MVKLQNHQNKVAHRVAHRVAHGLAHGPGPRFCPHPWYLHFWCRIIILGKTSRFNNDTGGSDFFLSSHLCL